MKGKSKLGVEIIEAAALVGILGDVMLRKVPWGINVTLFVVAVAAGYMMLVRRRRQEFWNASTLALNGALIFFAAMFAWRDSEELMVYDFLAILAIFALMITQSLGVRLPFAGVVHYVGGFIWSGVNAAFAPFALLLSDVEWKSAPKSGWKSGFFAVLRGLLLATPLIVVFGALFMAADAVFQGIVERTFNFDPSTIFSHVLFTGFLTWITAGYLRGALIGFSFGSKTAEAASSVSDEIKPGVASVTDTGEHDIPEETVRKSSETVRKHSVADFDNTILPRVFTLGAIEIAIVLGLMNLLFLSFVIVQIPYLFGGHQLVMNTPDFKLAEYARRGFGELIAVAALVLPILLVSNWLLRRDKPANETIFRVLAGIQIGLLFVIMASAAQRLFILTGSLGYGLTTTRFYPFVFMIWLAVVFVWFGWTVLRGNRSGFAWRALWSGLVILAALHFVNPDDYIVRTNLRLNAIGRDFDSDYNSRLSDDAVPALIESLDRLDETDRRVVNRNLFQKLCRKRTESDYRSVNISRLAALRALENSDAVRNHDGQCR